MNSVLVTGGAGYIGSHIVRRLQKDGRRVVVLDDLSEGHREAVPAGLLHVGDFSDRDLVRTICRDHDVDYVVHMAASCLVGESVENPARYYRNNVVNSLAFLEVVREAGVKGLVFSSTAAVYGEPVQVPITEDHPTAPTNPYGETKLAFERALSSYRKAYGLRYVALRYFNAAGADPGGDIGEDHEHESHLVPLLIRAAMKPTSPMKVFGTDYPTADGTCVRDYVHVSDLAAAHVLALGAMDRGEVDGASFNLGNGEGFSVRDVIRTVEQVVGQPVPVEDGPRRDGDPAVLVASSLRIRDALGWEPQIADLPSIIRTAWNWHRRNPNGFNG